MPTPPRSFTEVAGWREAFRDAAKRLDEVRTGSLFPDLPTHVCGEPVRPFTLRDWTILDQADSPFIAGGEIAASDACNLLWQLSRAVRVLTFLRLRGGKIERFLRCRLVWRVMSRADFDEDVVILETMRFIDDAFLDWPGRFAKPRKGGGGISPTQWPRKALEIEYCGEVMRAYPSFSYADLRAMPLAQFWQWLHDARAAKHPDYRNYQLTDHVNQQACDDLNRMRREAATASAN